MPKVPLPLLTPAEQPPPAAGELPDYRDGRDELNLAEFPISMVSHRADPNVKTLVFSRWALDKDTGEQVRRQLTVAASDRHGLPTALDDEVLLGLVQVSRIQRFASPVVTFTPYQLLRLLGRGTGTSDYRRLRESIERWLGVTLHYVNAWRDHQTKRWIDASFHFFESAEFHRPGGAREDALAPEGLSAVRWNDVIFSNLHGGSLKRLDFHRYRSLQSHIAKRMFRFLDKRLYQQHRGTFGLPDFACEHIGLVRPAKPRKNGGAPTTDVAQLKRRLLPAIQELERDGFLVPLAPAQRFFKLPGAKEWRVRFERRADSAAEAGPDPVQAPLAALEPDVAEITPLEGRLASHGMSLLAARRLAASHPAEQIELQLEALEFLLARDKNTVDAVKNRAGWLVRAVAESYALPHGFKPRAQLDQEARESALKAQQRRDTRQQDEARQQSEKARQDARYKRQAQRAGAYLAGLAATARAELEAAALSQHPLCRDGGAPDWMCREQIIQYVTGLLPPEPEGEPG